MSASFHDVRFPLSIARGARIVPTRRTEIVTLASGREERNTRWAHSRRRIEAGTGVKTLTDLHAVLTFFEERRGRLHAFRFADPVDHASAPPGTPIAPTDQPIGTGDGATTVFALARTYGSGASAYRRPVTKPVAGTVSVAVDGVPVAVSLDALTGLITLATAPEEGAAVTAGFAFDLAVRFDTDALEFDMAAFSAGTLPSIPLLEVL
ncbi:MAG: DUF2460 domain-containing protein [Hyphomicrobiaceae bacterium]|nr:DUF2460 domain-containing protein [Hyphomicrobiaceae bacterium]